MVHRIGFFNRIIQGSQAHPDRIDTPAEQRVSKLVGDVDGQAGHGDTLRAYASRKIKPLTPATAVRYLADMANQNALTVIALSALLGCGNLSSSDLTCPEVDFRKFKPHTSGGPPLLSEVECGDGAHIGIWLEGVARYRVVDGKWICDPFAICLEPRTIVKAYDHIK